MPSQNPRLELWFCQKKQFEQRAEGLPSAAWYWEIRIKIVRFLISRYGDQPGHETTGPEFETPVFATKLPARRGLPLGPKLKSPDRIRGLLASIRHEVAAAREFEVD